MRSLMFQAIRMAEKRQRHCDLALTALIQAADSFGYIFEPPESHGGDSKYVTLHQPSWPVAVFYMFWDRLNFRVSEDRRGLAKALIGMGGELIPGGASSSHPDEIRFWHKAVGDMEKCARALEAMADVTWPES
jgi:hypothetical protein